MVNIIDKIDFEKLNGLVPAVAQDKETREVLMVGFMNQAALEETIRTRHMTFWSRSRNTLWTKGETSGNILHVESIKTDCDKDTVLVEVVMGGHKVCCHTGEKSCFFVDIPL